MPTLLKNALLLDLDPLHVEPGSLLVDGSTIAARIAGTQRVPDLSPNADIVDCKGAVVMPGLVNGHTHLYSTLAVGMPSPPRIPQNFLEILQLVWWRLDRALDPESNELSAAIGALDALHCGTTTLIDHHASPGAIPGSLDRIEAGLARVGLRGVLCYEVTDRNGRPGRDAGIEENRRYLEKRASRKDGRFAGLVGAHASFTLADDVLGELSRMADRHSTGVHIHVAEDPCDEAACRADHQISLIDRLDRHGLLRPSSVFAHGTHLSPDAIARINAAGVTMAHNTRSNMNNAVGYAPIDKLKVPIMLGTDGIGSDLFAEAKTAWFKSRDAHAGISPADVIAMLVASARRASQTLGVELGKLKTGAAADIVVTDYLPFTPLDSSNAAGHLIFALAARDVRHVMVAGEWVLKDRQTVRCDERQIRSQSSNATRSLWDRLAAIQ